MDGNFEPKGNVVPERGPEDAEQFWREMENLLRKMLALAERSAEDTCGDAERAVLQKKFEGLQQRVNSMWTGCG